MANGYFERGEIYWVRMDNGFGGEQGVGRPGLILTENSINNKCSTVTVAFLSKQSHPSNPFYLPVEATGITSYVILNQIMTYDKIRIGKYLGVLNSSEQKAVDDALEDLFDLGYVDDTALKAKDAELADRDTLIGDLKTEVAGVKAEIGKKDEEIASLKMEIEMWQKCYGRCMDMLVDTKVNADLKRRTVTPPVKVVDPEEPVIMPVDPPKQPEQPSPVEEDRLDINHCTATALKKIGFSLAMARKIVQSRPFESVADLKRVNGLKSSMFRVMEPKLCCKPVVVEEPTETVEQTAVEPPVEKETDPGFEKLNLNAATAMELHKICGISQTAAYSITGYRKKNGLYKSIDELLNVKNVPKVAVERCREFLEV